MRVLLKQARRGPDKVVAKDWPGPSFSLRLPRTEGRFYVIAPRTLVTDAGICSAERQAVGG